MIDIEKRKQELQKFIQKNNLNNYLNINTLPVDASNRTYHRISLKQKKYIIMDDQSNDIQQFYKIAKHLNNNNVRVPNIISEKPKNGFLILEDLGNNTFTNLLNNGKNQMELYKKATLDLMKIQKTYSLNAINLMPYDLPTYLREVMLFIEWFYPKIYNKEADLKIKKSFKDTWIQILGELPSSSPVFVFRDFHADNIMIKNNKCVFLDFQDALIGNKAYDLASLLEDTRTNIKENVVVECYNLYKEEMQQSEYFDKAYNIINAQRHSKVLGIFTRLQLRDGKTKYKKYMKKTIESFFKSIEKNELLSLKKWVKENMPNIKNIIKNGFY